MDLLSAAAGVGVVVAAVQIGHGNELERADGCLPEALDRGLPRLSVEGPALEPVPAPPRAA